MKQYMWDEAAMPPEGEIRSQTPEIIRVMVKEWENKNKDEKLRNIGD